MHMTVLLVFVVSFRLVLNVSLPPISHAAEGQKFLLLYKVHLNVALPPIRHVAEGQQCLLL